MKMITRSRHVKRSRVTVVVMPVIAVIALVSPFAVAQEPDPKAVAHMKSISPKMLGRAYLVNENTLATIELARQGATVVFGEGNSSITVTAENAHKYVAEHELRRATYAAAIRERGIGRVAGEYSLTTKNCGEPESQGLVTLIQNDFVVETDRGAGGVIVANTLVIGEGDESFGAYWSGTIGRKIAMRPMHQDKCTLTLAAYERPKVELEQPERLIGRWQGRWNERSEARFTIRPADGGYEIHHEWQDEPEGPFKSRTFHTHASSKHSVRGGPYEIFLDTPGECGARIVAHFARPQTARLRPSLGAGACLPTDELLQEKLAEAADSLGWTALHEDPAEGLFIWGFSMPVPETTNVIDCRFVWHMKRAENSLAYDDPVTCEAGTDLSSVVGATTPSIQREFKARWLALAGPLALTGLNRTRESEDKYRAALASTLED